MFRFVSHLLVFPVVNHHGRYGLTNTNENMMNKSTNQNQKETLIPAVAPAATQHALAHDHDCGVPCVVIAKRPNLGSRSGKIRRKVFLVPTRAQL